MKILGSGIARNAMIFSMLAGFQGEAMAQQNPLTEKEVADIIVTANKRSENINKVGMSITAVDAETLLKAGVSDTRDLGKVVPGFYFTESLYGTPVLSLRGVSFNNTALGLSPAVSVYVDEVPLPYTAMVGGANLDVERIEALKGPQGVLFGNNSTGGAINYIAAAPTEDLHAGATLSYSRFGKFEGEGYLTGSLADNLTARLAGRVEQGGAWQVSRTRPNDRLGDRRKLSGRLLVDWAPTSRLSLRLNLNAWQDHSDTQARQAVAFRPLLSGTPFGLPDLAFVPAAEIAVFSPPSGRARDADWDPGNQFRNHSDFFQASLRARFEAGDDVDITSVTAYSRLTPYARVDTDGLAYPGIILTQRGRISSFFQELRIDARLTDRLSVMAGSNLSKDTVRDHLGVDTSISLNQLLIGAPRTNFDQRVDTTSSTYAGFIKADYRLTDTLRLTAAARYTDDDRRSDICAYAVDAGAAALQNALLGTALVPGDCVTATNGVPQVFHGKLHQHNLSMRLGAEWQVTPGALLYASFNRGYKAGGYPNLFALNSLQLKPVVQEQLDAYEAGAKISLLNHHVQLNAAYFHYDYINKQIQGRIIVPPLGPLESLVNVPKGTIDGVEAQLTVRPLDGLTLNAAGTYVDSEIGKGTQAYTPYGVFADVGGQAFPGTPKWQINGGIDYERQIGHALVMSGGVSAVYTGDNNGSFGNLSEFYVPGYTLIDANLGVGKDNGSWKISFNVRNLTDKSYYFASIQTIDVLNRYYGMPRTYGVTLQVKY